MEYSSKLSLSFASAMNLSACASRDASTQLAATTSQDDWGSHALRRTPREDCAAKYPQPQGHFYLSPGPWVYAYQGRNQNIIGVNLGYLCRVRLKFNVKLK